MKPKDWQCFYQQHWHVILFLPLVNIRYWFGLCHKKFKNSLLFTTHITIPHNFDDPLRVRWKMYCSAMQQRPTWRSKLTTEKIPNIPCCFWLKYMRCWRPGSVVGTATAYGLDGLGIESRWGEIFLTCPDRPWGPPSLLYNGYQVFPGLRCGRGVTLIPHTLLVPGSKIE